ncbi:MAG: response regulator transcription factor [Kiritimatiellae bacterium]|nr:response regulator transcription factor [Kiritimatiellia bacterium]
MRNTILVVDDERGIREGLKMQLAANGFEVLTARNGEEALKVYAEARPDLIVMDVMMPKLDGFAACREIRKGDKITPIVFLTCRDSEIDQVRAFEQGAVDFIRKADLGGEGMSEGVFVSILDRHIKRVDELINGGRGSEAVFMIGNAEVDTEVLLIVLPGEKVPITATEADLLKLLYRNRGKCVSYDMIIDELRGSGFVMDPHTLQVHVSRIKSKLGRAGSLIRNVRMRGYIIDR